MTNENTATAMRCGKCAGSGEYRFSSGKVEACYPCNGTGVSEYVAPVSRGPGATLAQRRESTRLTLRAIYSNAQAGRTSFADVTDGECWTAENLSHALDLVSGSREAFRALGWPV